MGAMASQITSLTIVYSTVYSDADQRKHQSSASLAFVRGIQMASNAENISFWWRHHVWHYRFRRLRLAKKIGLYCGTFENCPENSFLSFVRNTIFCDVRQFCCCHKHKIYQNKHRTSGDQDGHQSLLSSGGLICRSGQANICAMSWFARYLSISTIGVEDDVRRQYIPSNYGLLCVVLNIYICNYDKDDNGYHCYRYHGINYTWFI